MNDNHRQVVRIAMVMLSAKSSPTTEEVEKAIDFAMLMPHEGVVSRAAVLRDIQAQVVTSVGQSRELIDNDDSYVDWLPSRRGSIDWRFWDRY